MEEQKIEEALHSAIYGKNIKKIKELKDFFKDIEKGDISGIDIELLKSKKEIFRWIVDNPNYDFNKLFDNYFLINNNYSNNDIYEYAKLFYERIQFFIDKYDKKEFIIKYEDFD
ncbi:hypothetical protein MHM83_02975 [Tenacibaculum sp. Mcav3-52]|uniref:hypothetical protein n=1 Tax=Tenacibaculum TaxID=104267 RepID=UPI0006498270|nr:MULTISPECIES: hypothetical protein [Tenacibaculum]MCG7500825.1 hypothetical protein [Tenacibaculum sp. Mcav3-52]GFD75538.1 hypothetical protein KUL113_49580 [Tenacibaculum sp. KUL113]